MRGNPVVCGLNRRLAIFSESGLTEKRRSSAAYELRFPVSIGP